MISKVQRSLLILLLVLLLVGCGEEDPLTVEATLPPVPPTAVAEEVVAEVDFEAGQEEAIESIEVTEDGAVSTVQGELNLEYPQLMEAETNDSVVIKVHKLDVDRVPSPTYVKVSTEPNDQESANLGATKTHTANIYVTEEVTIELASQTFEIESTFGDTQKINLNDSNIETIWAWDIKAPQQKGAQKFTVKVFLEGESSPSWAGTFPITVLDELSDGSGVQPPVPESTGGIGGVLLIVLAILALGGAGAAVYFRQNQKPVDGKDEELEPVYKRSTAEILNSNYKVELSETLEEALNTAELKDLCFDLDVNYENFEGGLVEKIQAVVSYFIRHSRVQELLDYLAKKRPDIDLPKHQLVAILEDQFSRTELQDLCAHLEINTANIKDDSAEMIRAIMALLTRSNPSEDVVDYLAEKHPEIDLLKDG